MAKKKLGIVTRLLVLSLIAVPALALEYTTQHFKNLSPVFHVLPHYRHVVAYPVTHSQLVPEVGQRLSSVLPTGFEGQAPNSPQYEIWQRYCHGEHIGQDDYKVIEMGIIPEDLQEMCAKKHK